MEDSQDQLRTAGQRRVNLIWEVTQSMVALGITFSTIYVAIVLSLAGETQTLALNLLENAFYLVVGFYFGRTNHQRIGGVGEKDGGR